jgi:hypothetical protein
MFSDTIKKVVARFKRSPRIREVYFGPLKEYQRKVIFLKDIDSTNGKLLFEAYGWDGKLMKSNTVTPLDSEESVNPELVLNHADYETRIKFYIVDSKTPKYTFKCKLMEQIPFPPVCGNLAWALVQKFEVLKTDFPGFTSQHILIIQPCPEFMGKAFFKRKRIYKIGAATNSGVTFGYSILNKYKKERSPIFWCREIEPVTK